MPEYSIRITQLDNCNPETLMTIMNTYSTEFIFYKEVGSETGKTHLQGHIVIETQKMKNALADTLKRKLKLTGNRDYSIKMLKTEEHINNNKRYCTKDQNYYCSNVSDEVLHRYYEEYSRNQQLPKIKKKIESFSQMLDSRFSNYISSLQEYETYKLNQPEELVIDWLLKQLPQHIKTHNEIDITKWYWMLLARNFEKDYYISMKKKILDRVII